MFFEGGTYTDPVTNGPLTGRDIGGFAEGLFASFPDLSFEITSNAEAASGVVLEWTMRGTNTGSLRGLPPTGARIAQPGIDVIRVSGDKVLSVRGYFDRQTMLEQLGLQVVVQPHQVGPITFGVSTRVRSASNATPGAFSLTMVDARSEEEVQEIRMYSRRIMLGMPSMPGFLSFLGAVVGRRLYTISAWTGPEEARGVMREQAHREASSEFLSGELGTAFHSSIWIPHHLSERRIRCPSCGRINAATQEQSTCGCGTVLPDLPAFW
jgi:predicted ester cyclase